MKQTINLYAADGCWLYKDEEDPNVREFLKSVTIPSEECLPYWHECTDEEKVQWEEEHTPQPEPTPEPEPEPSPEPSPETSDAEPSES